MKPPPPTYPHKVFVEAPAELDKLRAKAAEFEPEFEMSYVDNGVEFRFNDKVAHTQFVFFFRFGLP